MSHSQEKIFKQIVLNENRIRFDTNLNWNKQLQNISKKHIFLTGFMGAGKSRIGKLLAIRFACSFYDSDRLIEDTAGTTIKEIFETRGEASFRALETEAISKLCSLKKRAVIALGGGANINPVNSDLISQNGITVYIKSAPQAIFERVRHSDKRPLLQVEKGDNFDRRLLERIEILLNERNPVYEQADIVFERDGFELEEIVDKLYHQITYFKDKS
jgi:shikimate kinase